MVILTLINGQNVSETFKNQLEEKLIKLNDSMINFKII